ncbi:hypothetical protein INT43_000663 [Umbelopsis isabellina]|uniref:Inositol hexakisphosphate and diphosphoinositol-pentakisphosphate kinase n=1 Tax=Mortierella isabellina TaxID=91625 RepID=A0A8H7Q3A2_MORIS|nr:hypothetical protein INT43_000663 [Umbelopsis isabellina]
MPLVTTEVPKTDSEQATQLPPNGISSPVFPTPPSPTLNRAKYVVGVCAMDCKARSKPMRYILNRLLAYGDYDIVVFGDNTILDEDIEKWPGCDFLISFFSTGFPLEKAIQYTKLRKPYSVNSLPMQHLLWDRRVVLTILNKIGVPTPYRLEISRDGGPKIDPEAARAFKRRNGIDLEEIMKESYTKENDVQILDDSVVVNGQILNKPYVEKPVDGEDHNINIYYAGDEGGRRLFRKIGNKSSEYDKDLLRPREKGSYIYEQFMNVDNAEDVKVYTVGPNFTHAETRKSPVVDGLVKRNTDGKEIRYCVELTPEEKVMASKLSATFGQTICGFDLLRVNGKSYVIDVNGWSFVKGSEAYYDNCARILSDAFKRSVRRRNSIIDIPPEISPEHSWRLKGFVAVLRHADRTPKQKFKISVTSKPFVDLLQGSDKEVVFRQKHQLAEFQQATTIAKNQQLEDLEKLDAILEILNKKSEMPGTKVQLKPSFDKESLQLVKIQLIVKWGGEFTHAGLHQARDFGVNLRKDMIIMNKTLLENNIKIYSSSERRVRATADVFARSFLDGADNLDGLVVESKDILDDSNAAKEQCDRVKLKLKDMLSSEVPGAPDIMDGRSRKLNLAQPAAIAHEIINLMNQLRQIMRNNFATMDIDSIQRRWCCHESPALFKERWERHFNDFCNISEDDVESSISESDNDKPKVEIFAPSKIPELYDTLKYDALHNRAFMTTIFVDQEATLTTRSSDVSESYSRASTESSMWKAGDGLANLKRLYHCVRILFNYIAPQEFGINNQEKREIGMLISLPLMKKIIKDLEEIRAQDEPRTRLYFTKESHVHTLLNLIFQTGISAKTPRELLPELDYLTQITFELYERQLSADEEKEHSLRIGFSPGAHYDSVLDLQMDAEHCLKTAPRRTLVGHLPLEELLNRSWNCIKQPDMTDIERQIEERKLYYAQEDD